MREIDPKDVPQMMKDGTLEFGMELEFQIDEYQWSDPISFSGFSIIGPHHFEGRGIKYNSARFPQPKLRDGDPVVVGGYENALHYKRIFKEYDREGNFVTWDEGYSRWTSCERASISHSWPYGRPATTQELSEAGYSTESINEMTTRWGTD